MRSKKKPTSKRESVKAQTKMYAYICSLAGNQDFLNAVLVIRTRYSLPEKGFENDIEDVLAFVEGLPLSTDEEGNPTDFQKDIYTLATQNHITLAWLEAVQDYVLYDDFFFTKISPLVQMVDVLEVINDADTDKKEDGRTLVRRAFENLSDSFPLAIFVSPYATGRDIIDYVKKEYKKTIEPAQIEHRDSKSKIGKVRHRSVTVSERDLFICKHKDLPAQKIVSLVSKKYGVLLDYSYVNRIIAKKCKRKK